MGIELTSFDLNVIIPILSAVFLALVLCILFIFKNQTKRSEEWQKSKDQDDKKRDETLVFLKENLVILQTSHEQLVDSHKLVLEKIIV